ncbi:MAG TPA: hypothetical protein VEW03_03750, partial [Longimicrobiaceae bacterium]|nr:hypothetical protein [Longimicrobiaceae bacterium]
MRRSLVMVGVLAGCASLTGREPGKSQGWAGAESFHCSQRVVRELGYAILDIDHGAEYLRATRNFGQENGSEY